MASKINCRCYRCSKKISDTQIKRIGVRIDTDENAFTFCSECVKGLEAWIAGEDVVSEPKEHIIPVPSFIKHRYYDEDKVNEPENVDEVKGAEIKEPEIKEPEIKEPEVDDKSDAIKKFEERQAKAVKMEELDKLDQKKPKEQYVYNITFASLNRFNKAIKLLEQNRIEFKRLQHVDGIEDMPWGVLQIRRDDYKLWRKVYLDAETKEASEVKPVTITLPEKPVRKVEPVEEKPTIRKVEPVKVETPCKTEVDGSKYPPIKKEDVPFRNRNAFHKGGIRCWNLIYFILKSGSSATEVAEAYGLRPLAFQNMTSASYMSSTRVNTSEPYEVKEVKLVKALRKFAEDNGVRYEDLTYVRDIQGPFEELYFKPAPERIVLEKHPTSYN